MEIAWRAAKNSKRSPQNAKSPWSDPLAEQGYSALALPPSSTAAAHWPILARLTLRTHADWSAPSSAQLGPTKEWAENNYYKLRIDEQSAELVTVNAFWRDYAAWVAAGSKGGFVSSNVAEASRNFTEMMLALAVLDLPFEAAKHTTKADNGQFTFTAGGPVILYHKEIKPAATENNAQGQLLVSQSFFRHGDRYRQEGNEKFEKYVTTEFLTGATYGANIVVTNPTSSPVKAVVLLQIPQGALPVLGSKATNSRQVRLEPYTTQTFEYHFYFPLVPAKAGLKFAHFPVNVATATGSAAAKPFEFNAVAKLTEVDKASWDYVSQYGSDAEVFSFLDQNNLEGLNLERIAWRCRKSGDFYQKLVAFMNQHHVADDAVFSYAFLHNDASTLGQMLKDDGESYGPYLASKLLTIEPIELRSYEHLEYSPLVNQRAHRVGSEWRVANPAVLEEYTPASRHPRLQTAARCHGQHERDLLPVPARPRGGGAGPLQGHRRHQAAHPAPARLLPVLRRLL
jgi:hypothetical protein